MKLLLQYIILSALCLFAGQSCLDSSYDLDKIDKSAVFNLGTFPIGEITPLVIKEYINLPIDHIPPITLPGNGLTLFHLDTVYNIFDKKVIDQFFYEGERPLVGLKAIADLRIQAHPGSNPSAGLYFELLNSKNEVIKDITISKISLVGGQLQPIPAPNKHELADANFSNQTIALMFTSKDYNPAKPNVDNYKDYMKDAKSLKITLMVKTSQLSYDFDDYIYIHDLKISAGTIAFDL